MVMLVSCFKLYVRINRVNRIQETHLLLPLELSTLTSNDDGKVIVSKYLLFFLHLTLPGFNM